MWPTIYALRALAVLGPYAVFLLVRLTGSAPPPKADAAPPAKPPIEGSRAPLAATAVAVGLLFFCLGWPLTIPGLDETGYLLCAAAGPVLTAVGTVIAYRARAALGASWSLAPRANPATGLVTSGPYAYIRHPIYLGFALGLLAVAVAFANWPALLVVFLLLLPCLLWRARVEERLLTEVFGDDYRLYRRRTWMLIPYLL